MAPFAIEKNSMPWYPFEPHANRMGMECCLLQSAHFRVASGHSEERQNAWIGLLCPNRSIACRAEATP